MLGAHEEAIGALEASLAECARLGILGFVAGAQQDLGLALGRLGRHTEAEAAERAAVEAFAKGGNALMEAGSRAYLARILVSAGRAREAVAEASRAAALLPPEHAVTSLAHAALVDALLARGEPGDAAQALLYARAARGSLRASPESFEEPAPILRAHIDALTAGGLHPAAERARAEARAWVLARAERLRSERYRTAFLRDEPDNARIIAAR